MIITEKISDPPLNNEENPSSSTAIPSVPPPAYAPNGSISSRSVTGTTWNGPNANGYAQPPIPTAHPPSPAETSPTLGPYSRSHSYPPSPNSTHLAPTPGPPSNIGNKPPGSVQHQYSGQPLSPYPPHPSPNLRDPVQVGRDYQAMLLARCAEGSHDYHTHYGVGGIICAVVLFPFGLLALCVDQERKCTRCGMEAPP